jgi:hypothetical protein
VRKEVIFLPNLLSKLPEVIVSDATTTEKVSRSVKNGKLRKLASRLYTTNLSDAPEAIVKRNLWHIIGQYVPEALIADRTALELKPAPDGSIFIISDRKRPIELPGITIRSRKGVAPLPEDKAFVESLRLSSQARAYLENMRISRPRKDSSPRTLSRQEIEEKLDEILRRSGNSAIKQLRDEARMLAHRLDLEKEFQQLDDLIGTLLGTRDEVVVSKTGIARKKGEPYDPDRLQLFEVLYLALHDTSPITRPASAITPTLAFYEAYFSNFIEGTEFAVREAEEIIFEGRVLTDRPADAHDVLGTYRIVADTKEMQRIPRRFEDFLILLKQRHAVIMEKRPEKLPGQFKVEGNRAGSTFFVKPDLVEGTLKKGFELYQSLDAPFHRAVFIMFLVAEVHPFADGNGRVARIMMNAELVAGCEQRIIVPTVYRNNYLVALKALTHNQQPRALVRTLDFAQRYTSKVDWSNKHISQQILEATHAFVDPTEADLNGIRLTIPDDDLVAGLLEKK